MSRCSFLKTVSFATPLVLFASVTGILGIEVCDHSNSYVNVFWGQAFCYGLVTVTEEDIKKTPGSIVRREAAATTDLCQAEQASLFGKAVGRERLVLTDIEELILVNRMLETDIDKWSASEETYSLNPLVELPFKQGFATTDELIAEGFHPPAIPSVTDLEIAANYCTFYSPELQQFLIQRCRTVDDFAGGMFSIGVCKSTVAQSRPRPVLPRWPFTRAPVALRTRASPSYLWNCDPVKWCDPGDAFFHYQCCGIKNKECCRKLNMWVICVISLIGTGLLVAAVLAIAFLCYSPRKRSLSAQSTSAEDNGPYSAVPAHTRRASRLGMPYEPDGTRLDDTYVIASAMQEPPAMSGQEGAPCSHVPSSAPVIENDSTVLAATLVANPDDHSGVRSAIPASQNAISAVSTNLMDPGSSEIQRGELYAQGKHRK